MRLDAHDYFLMMAKAAAQRATCPRLSVGAVAVRQGRVVGTGYNGSLPGEAHCLDEGCLLHEGHCLRTIHAERNALIHATEKPDTLYCTHMPCLECLKEAVASGVWFIYYVDAYRQSEARERFIEGLVRKPIMIQRVPPEVTL